MVTTSKMTVVQNQRVMNLPQVGRKTRSPQHSFNLVNRPFGIYPFMIAPVLAGETLKSALMQSRVITDPIRDRHIVAPFASPHGDEARGEKASSQGKVLRQCAGCEARRIFLKEQWKEVRKWLRLRR